ncbi:ABC transporter permease subunit [Natrinema ejinorense]|uniref:ABC transporter permease subunit n=1 Tax=Natrinema ejinorense TaxID=373386 RepID=UPI001474DACE|nr:ABC transporter permease subunit [Natrinema ejinorense]
MVLLESRLLSRSVTNWVLTAGVLSLVVGPIWRVLGSDIGSERVTPFLVLESGQSATARYWLETADLLVLLLPLIAFLYGYEAFPKERERGTLFILGSAPLTRRDVLIAKVAARVAWLAAAIGLGVLLSGIGLILLVGGFDPVGHLLAGLITIIFAGGLLTVGSSLSVYCSTRWACLTGIVFGYLGLEFAGALLLSRVSSLVVIHPFQAYVTLIAAPFDTMYPSLTASLSDGSVTEYSFGPFFTPSLALPVLVGWICGPVVLGHRRFRREVIGA